MGAAAKLGGIISHFYHSDCFAVFFTEQSHGACSLCAFHIGFYCLNGTARKDSLVHLGFSGGKLLGGHCRKMREVEANFVFVNIGACLLNMAAQYLTQRRLKQVRRGVVAFHRVSAG